jgi:hypothetical protein
MAHHKAPGTPAPTPNATRMETVIAILVSLVAVAAIVGSRKFPGTGLSTDIGSARFPLIYACALVFLSAVLVIQNWLKSRNAPTPAANPEPANASAETPSHWRAFFGMVATALCVGAMPFAGYLLSTGLYLSFLMGLLGMRQKLWNPLLALAITVAMYFIFSTGLHVPLPTGSLFE